MGMVDAMARQDGRRVVHRMALGKTAEVDAHALAGELHAARARVEFEAAPADRGTRARQGLRVRRHTLAVVVQVADAGEGDVEGALRELGKALRLHQQQEHLVGQRHRFAVRVAVDAREFGVRLVRAHRAVDAVHLGHHLVDRRFAARNVLAPQLDADRRAHHRLVAGQPVAAVGIHRACRGSHRMGGLGFGPVPEASHVELARRCWRVPVQLACHLRMRRRRIFGVHLHEAR